MVIVEYCKYGNIQSILRTHGSQFIDQIIRAKDVIDPNVCNRHSEVEEASAEITQRPDTDALYTSQAVPNDYTSAPRGGSRMKIMEWFVTTFHSIILI